MLKRPTSLMAVISFAISALLFVVHGANAQSGNPYGIAVKVNDTVITNFELEQRILMMQAFGTTGEMRQIATDQLIDERLRMQAAKSLNIEVSEDELFEGMEQFATRGSLTTEQLNQYLAQRGVASETFRDFVKVGYAWRNFIRARFGAQGTVTDREIDSAIALSTGRQQESVLFSEIVIPTNERGDEATLELAKQLSRSIRSEAAFSAAARRYSRSPSAGRGGRLDWVSVGSLPPNVVGQVMALSPGEVTGPITMGGAIGLFQLRGTRKDAPSSDNPLTLIYATVHLPSGDQRAAASTLFANSDTCADLKAVSEIYGKSAFTESAGSVSEIPQTVALELAKLDPNEGSTYTSVSGRTVAVMLCSRNRELAEGDRESIQSALFSQRLGSFAQGYLQELKGDAIIIHP